MTPTQEGVRAAILSGIEKGGGMTEKLKAPVDETYCRVWYWKTKLPERKGTCCRVLARGKKNSIMVEFEADKYRVLTSRNAVRLIKNG